MNKAEIQKLTQELKEEMFIWWRANEGKTAYSAGFSDPKWQALYDALMGVDSEQVGKKRLKEGQQAQDEDVGCGVA